MTSTLIRLLCCLVLLLDITYRESHAQLKPTADSTVTAHNYVVNSGFESGSTPWGFYNASRIALVAPQVGHAARIDGTGGGVWQTVSGLQPGTTYMVTATASISESGQNVYIYAKNYSATTSSRASPVFTESQPALYAVAFTTGPDHTTAEIGVWKNSGPGYTVIDDFNLFNPESLIPPPKNIATWRSQHFTQADLTDPSLSADEATPLGDGVANRLKYHLGISPWERVPAEAMPVSGFHGEADAFFGLSFRHSRNAPDSVAVVEWSNDLVQWCTYGVTTEVLERTSNHERVRASIVANAESGLFLRLRIGEETEARTGAEAMVERLIADRSLVHEVRPHGILVSWAARPRGGSSVSINTRSVNMWGQVYMGMDGDPEALMGLRVEMKDVRLFVQTSDGQWHQLHAWPQVAGADFREDFAANETQVSDRVFTAAGNVAVRLRPNWNYHLWSAGSNGGWRDITGFESNGETTIIALASAYKARLIDAESLGLPDPGNVARARIVAGVGGDLLNKDGSFGWDWGIGRFRKLSEQWTPVTFVTASREGIWTNPPPLYNATDPDWNTPAPLAGWSSTDIGFAVTAGDSYSQNFNSIGYGQAIPGWTVTGGVEREDQRITAFGDTANGTPTAIFDTQGGASPISMTITADTGVAYTPGRLYHMVFRLWKSATAHPYEGRFTFRLFAGNPDSGGVLIGSGELDGATDGYEAWRDVSWPISLMSNSATVTSTPNIFLQFIAPPPTNTEGLAQVQLDSIVITEVVPPPQTDFTYRAGVWTVTGRGEGLNAQHDRLSFVGRYLAGDQVLERRIGPMTMDAPTATAGLMMRAHDVADAPFVAVLITGTGAVQMRWRSGPGQAVQTLNAVGASSASTRLRLTRTGESYTASFSDDGQAWNDIGTCSATIPEQAYLGGMMVSSSSVDLPNTVLFY